MIFYARYIVSSLMFLFFNLFYCNFWLSLESFYPVTSDMYFYLMFNKDTQKPRPIENIGQCSQSRAEDHPTFKPGPWIKMH